jgi:hypothetical protein
MNRNSAIIAAAVLSVLLAATIVWRISQQKTAFDRVVHEAHKTTEGYDQRFIDMVNRLEQVLATRASFGYAGGKDPMTGKQRTVVLPSAPPQPGKTGEAQTSSDPFKLTAVIFDDEEKQYTAIIMIDERSLAVELGDVVGSRRVTKITNDRVFMEDDSAFYFYDISGRKGYKSRFGDQAPVVTPVPGQPAQAPAQTPAPVQAQQQKQ